jgi:GH24 family phage-related lysozyme (muramidase)
MRKLLIVVWLLCSIQAHCQPAVPCVRSHVTYAKLTQHEFDAMVDFTFNAGCHAFTTSTLLKKVNRGDIAGAANEFPKWTKAKGRVLPGLVRRRADERRLFLKPSD